MLAALAIALTASACEREVRRFQKPQSAAPQPTAARQGELQPGQAGDGLTETRGSPSFDPGNAYELSQGKRLFRWYNCSGCHSSGGGGMGPALMDEKWIYGHEPEHIYATIMEGRPNGMPSFRGRIPEEQVWQLVGYVRSMSGLAPKAARPSRSDALGGAIKPESQRGTLPPKTDAEKAK
jgi:cytochrome c oxidase cbb3-type subunit 3